MNLKSETLKRYQVINRLSRHRKPTLSEMNKELGIPIPTLKRIIANLRKEYGMNISYINESAKKEGVHGYYILASWGIINRSAFLKTFGMV